MVALICVGPMKLLGPRSSMAPGAGAPVLVSSLSYKASKLPWSLLLEQGAILQALWDENRCVD